MNAKSKSLIQQYYDAFNQGDMKTFLNLLDENIIHDINQGTQEVGRAAFDHFMQHMNVCYQEKITDLVIMANESGTRASAEFMVEGVYLKTDKGLPEAQQQKYRLPAGAFFEIKNGKIARITNYYNLQDWLAQVK